jgi:malate synthase
LIDWLIDWLLQLGIMDEERRTSINLAQCIHAAKDRVFFINTGFLDRTGDEIHTHFHAGAIQTKKQIQHSQWFQAYEARNVRVGLAFGFAGRAQIGKGMWALPDEMHAMYTNKIQHVRSGASTAWVPSPMAAAIHALHYHQVDVHQVQRDHTAQLLQQVADSSSSPPFAQLLERLQVDMLLPPLMTREQRHALSADDVQRELENNVQAILGYVVRWVGQGIGCSKVPNIDRINMMEDRATLRIASQHVANWLHHGIIQQQQLTDAMQSLARLVDQQNVSSSGGKYRPMASDFSNSAEYQAALALIHEAAKQPNGYTESILHAARLQVKEHNAMFASIQQQQQ